MQRLASVRTINNNDSERDGSAVHLTETAVAEHKTNDRLKNRVRHIGRSSSLAAAWKAGDCTRDSLPARERSGLVTWCTGSGGQLNASNRTDGGRGGVELSARAIGALKRVTCCIGCIHVLTSLRTQCGATQLAHHVDAVDAETAPPGRAATRPADSRSSRHLSES